VAVDRLAEVGHHHERVQGRLDVRPDLKLENGIDKLTWAEFSAQNESLLVYAMQSTLIRHGQDQ
jgi:hypothetical protein